MIKQISSLQNPMIKELILIKEKSRARRRSGKFLIEGLREVSLAIKGGYTMQSILFNPSVISIEKVNDLIGNQTECIEVSNEVYERLAYRESTQGIIAVSEAKSFDLESISLSENPLILVAEAPEKPGNIGALLRTADAANVDAVIIANPKTDLFNPNIIRSSVGCVFTNTIATGSTEEIITFLKQHNINMYCASLQASIPYHTADFKSPTAIVVGTESTGLSASWIDNATQYIIIPMQGEIDSLNVSVSAGILIFEAKRQRNFNS
ncbi:MAG: RNA methyltransferase [Bacteroidia bacterium]|nr:RNA methyltransferase [Bacteroidia bacterium]NNK60452.1 RNA methyltransferase [Flavobacteriaceae bacterium]